MIQEYQVSGFRVREYEELRSTNTEAERVGWDELEDKMVILTYKQTQGIIGKVSRGKIYP